MDIKKIKKEIYKFNFINSELEDRFAILSINEDGLDELLIALKKTDFENGISVIPSGYTSGLYYSNLFDGEIYSSPYKLPDITDFRLDIDGLKSNGWYRIKVLARDYGDNDMISTLSSDRSLYVTTSNNELLIDDDLTNVSENKEYDAIFKSTSSEISLIFKIGSIFISNIIIEEIEPDTQEEQEELFPHNIIGEGKYKLHAWGIYNMNLNLPQGNSSFIRLTQLGGQGLALFYDIKNDELCLERDNINTTLIEPFTNNSYVIEMNTNKVVQYKEELIYDNFINTSVSPDLSPNTRELGFTKYAFIKNGKKIKYSNDNSKLTVMIWKIV